MEVTNLYVTRKTYWDMSQYYMSHEHMSQYMSHKYMSSNIWDMSQHHMSHEYMEKYMSRIISPETVCVFVTILCLAHDNV